MDESRRRRVRLIAFGLAALVLLGVALYQHEAPVFAVPDDAQAAAKLLAAHGYRSDFTPSSLWDVDHYIEEGVPGEGARDVKLRELGAYTGEVIRRTKGGKWAASPNAPAGVELELPDGTRCSPHGRVARRIEGGRDQGVAPYAQTFGVDVHPVPDWWLRR